MDQYSVIIALCFLLILYFIYWLNNILRFRKILNKFPGRKCSFLIGDVERLSLQSDKLFVQLRECAKEFTSGYRMYGGQFGSVNFIIPEDIEVILSSSKHIEKSGIYSFLHPWLGTGLLTSTDNKWLQRRKILTPAFHFNILRRFITIFGEHNERLIEEIRAECSKSKTNIMPLMSLHTLNIICETAMGVSLNSNNNNIKEYCKAIHGVGTLIIERTLCPWIYYDCIYFFTPSGRRMVKYLKTLHQFSSKVINDRERTFKESDLDNLNNDDEDTGIYAKRRFAMLDLLLLAKKRHGQIDDAGIREEVDTFMFEGHDTTAMGLSFTLFMLANHKHIQGRVREELDQIFEDSTRSADYKDLQSMQYLEMCIKESLRLYPSVPFISRIVFEEVSFRNGQYKIPAECGVNIHIYDLHRNPKVFPDPEKFDPDRFLPENVKNRHPYAYIPFSAGPRNCIGQKFAMLELKSVISSILRNFIIEPIDTPENLVMNMDLVLRPKDGIHVKFKPRID